MHICNCREEDEMTVQNRLQRYQQQYQDIQASYSQAKLGKKLDPQEENRKLLLAGGDPSKRQRELQVTCQSKSPHRLPSSLVVKDICMLAVSVPQNRNTHIWLDQLFRLLA